MKAPANFNDLMVKHNWNKTTVARELGVNRWEVWKWAKERSKDLLGAPREKEVESDTIRKLREEAAKTSRLSTELKAERTRRELAEADLAEALERDRVLRSVAEREVVARELSSVDSTEEKPGCSAIICATDWHLEKNIVPSTVSGLNEFNLEIAERRINRLWQKSIYLIDFFRHIGNVNEVIIWLGGDLINNHLHEEDAESNFAGPAEAVSVMQDHIATGITGISKSVQSCANLRVVCNYGNHARTTKRQRQGTGWKHSWEWLTYVTMAKMFPLVEFQIAEGYFNHARVQGRDIRFHHGESVNYYGGVGGLTIPMTKALAQWDKARHADYSINGHYHSFQDHWTWTSCGCLCGYDSFAQSIKADYQVPTQTVVFIDKSRGKVAVLPVFVEGANHEVER